MSGKRGAGEGNIKRRADGRWEARLRLPDGTRKSFYAKTRQEVARLLSAAIHDSESGIPVVTDKENLEAYLSTWLEVIQHQIKPSSYRRYCDIVRQYINPALGKVALSKITPQQLQTFYARLLSKGLSPSSVELVHVILHKAMKDALRLGIIQRNVVSLVQPPRRKSRLMKTLSEEDALKFMAAARGERFEALFVLALTTGMREGELLALQWKDIDLDKSTVQVRGTLLRDGNRFVIAEPKSAKSRRSIALSKRAAYVLRLHHSRQEHEKALLGEEWDITYDLVFPNTLGKPMKPCNLSQDVFKRVLRKAGLPNIRFHDLRHTAATLLLGKGINPKIVSEMLGHSQISITLDIYSHVTPHMQQQAADAMDTLFED
jgi:integrase